MKKHRGVTTLLYLSLLLLVSTSSLWAQSPFGKALYLNRNYQFIKIPDAEVFECDLQRNLAFEFWMNPETSEKFNLINKWEIIKLSYGWRGTGYFIDLNCMPNQSDFSNILEISVLSPGSLCCFMAKTTVSCVGVGDFTTIDVKTGEWNHFAWVYTAEGIVYHSLNGTMECDGCFSSPLVVSNPGFPLCIGGFPLAIDSTLENRYYFNGYFDEIRIWNIEKSNFDIAEYERRIQATMNDTLGPEYYSTSDSGLVAYFRLDKLENLGIGGDGLTDDVRDLSMYGNHADLVGGPELIVSDVSVNVDESEVSTPLGYLLSKNYPNPFNSSTTIRFQLPKSDFVSLKVYDQLGKEIVKLIGEYCQAGENEVQWKATNLPTGIYLYRIEAGEYMQTRKMMLVR